MKTYIRRSIPVTHDVLWCIWWNIFPVKLKLGQNVKVYQPLLMSTRWKLKQYVKDFNFESYDWTFLYYSSFLMSNYCLVNQSLPTYIIIWRSELNIMSQHLYTFKSVTRGLRSYHHHHHLYHHHLDCHHHHHDHDNHHHHDQQRLKWPLWNPFPELQPTKRQYPSLCIKSWWIFSGCIPVLSPSPVLYLCPSFLYFLLSNSIFVYKFLLFTQIILILIFPGESFIDTCKIICFGFFDLLLSAP